MATTVLQPAQAGTIESGDVLVTVAPAEVAGEISIDIDSIVLPQYGEAIRQTLLTTAREVGVTEAYIKAVDRGALDCTIRARALAALYRAGVEEQGGEGQ